jgi:hypothetical protein
MKSNGIEPFGVFSACALGGCACASLLAGRLIRARTRQISWGLSHPALCGTIVKALAFFRGHRSASKNNRCEQRIILSSAPKLRRMAYSSLCIGTFRDDLRRHACPAVPRVRAILLGKSRPRRWHGLRGARSPVRDGFSPAKSPRTKSFVPAKRCEGPSLISALVSVPSEGRTHAEQRRRGGLAAQLCWLT